MMEWLSAHSGALQVLLSGAMVMIWIAYLQVFLMNFKRQHRPDILINMGAGIGLRARCFVSNLALEPIYLLDVIVEIETENGPHRATITDRTEMTDEALRNPAEATNQGPLKSGDFIDIGNFETLVNRASSSDRAPDAQSDIRAIEITVVAATAAKWSLIGAQRKYILQRDDDGRVSLKPVTITASQITSRGGRRKLQRELEAVLAD